MTRELRRKLDELAIECEDTYSMANRTEDMLEEIFNDHEAQLKDANEEIERLKAELKHYKELASDLDNELRNTQWELSDLKDTKCY